jgi:hypothetical protein
LKLMCAILILKFFLRRLIKSLIRCLLKCLMNCLMKCCLNCNPIFSLPLQGLGHHHRTSCFPEAGQIFLLPQGFLFPQHGQMFLSAEVGLFQLVPFRSQSIIVIFQHGAREKPCVHPVRSLTIELFLMFIELPQDCFGVP